MFCVISRKRRFMLNRATPKCKGAIRRGWSSNHAIRSWSSPTFIFFVASFSLRFCSFCTFFLVCCASYLCVQLEKARYIVEEFVQDSVCCVVVPVLLFSCAVQSPQSVGLKPDTRNKIMKSVESNDTTAIGGVLERGQHEVLAFMQSDSLPRFRVHAMWAQLKTEAVLYDRFQPGQVKRLVKSLGLKLEKPGQKPQQTQSQNRSALTAQLSTPTGRATTMMSPSSQPKQPTSTSAKLPPSTGKDREKEKEKESKSKIEKDKEKNKPTQQSGSKIRRRSSSPPPPPPSDSPSDGNELDGEHEQENPDLRPLSPFGGADENDNEQEENVQPTVDYTLVDLSVSTCFTACCCLCSFVPRAVMKHPIGFRFFSDYLKAEYSDENLNFWDEVTKLVSLSDDFLQLDKAKFIVDEFISDMAPQQLGLKRSTRKAISDAVQTGLNV